MVETATKRIIEPKIRSVLQQPLTVGESPVWDEETGALWLVDILAPAIVRISPDDKADRFEHFEVL